MVQQPVGYIGRQCCAMCSYARALSARGTQRKALRRAWAAGGGLCEHRRPISLRHHGPPMPARAQQPSHALHAPTHPPLTGCSSSRC